MWGRGLWYCTRKSGLTKKKMTCTRTAWQLRDVQSKWQMGSGEKNTSWISFSSFLDRNVDGQADTWGGLKNYVVCIEHSNWWRKLKIEKDPNRRQFATDVLFYQVHGVKILALNLLSNRLYNSTSSFKHNTDTALTKPSTQTKSPQKLWDRKNSREWINVQRNTLLNKKSGFHLSAKMIWQFHGKHHRHIYWKSKV